MTPGRQSGRQRFEEERRQICQRRRVDIARRVVGVVVEARPGPTLRLLRSTGVFFNQGDQKIRKNCQIKKKCPQKLPSQKRPKYLFKKAQLESPKHF